MPHYRSEGRRQGLYGFFGGLCDYLPTFLMCIHLMSLVTDKWAKFIVVNFVKDSKRLQNFWGKSIWFPTGKN